MSTIFLGGSRQVTRLPPDVKRRLDNVLASGHNVLIGDAAGVDKAVQRYLFDRHYDNVTVFCSGDAPRNNLGNWQTHHVYVPKSAKGFHFYAAKDREMARAADFGLMIWDGKSPGTVLNVLRLALAGKIAVVFNVTQKDVINVKTLDNWRALFLGCDARVQMDVKERATPEEWNRVSEQPGLFPTEKPVAPASPREQLPSIEEILNILNEALAHCDEAAVMKALGLMARERGMSHISRETGLARESLYRSLDAKGNPEFATVLKVLSSIGLRLEAKQSFEAV